MVNKGTSKIEDTFVNKPFSLFVFTWIMLLLSDFFTGGDQGRLVQGLFAVIYVTIVFIFFYREREITAFLMFVYGASHYYMAPNFGGLTTLISVPISLYLIVNRKVMDFKQDNVVRLLIFVFLIMNFLGWLFVNKAPGNNILFGAISLFGYLLIFGITSNLLLSIHRLRFIISMILIWAIYNFLTSVIARLFPIQSISILAPVKFTETESNMYFVGILGRNQGDYSLSLLFFFIPFALNDFSWRVLKINRNLLHVGIITLAISALLFQSKTIFALLFPGLLILIIYVFSFSHFFNTRRLVLVLGVVGYMVIITSLIFPFDYIFERFEKQPRIFENVLEDFLLARGTSREQSFTMGLNRVMEKDWIVGYGWTAGYGLRYVWFDDPMSVKKFDFHNMYYSLPPLFGWIGGFAYLFLFLYLIARTLSRALTSRYLLTSTLGFSFSLMYILFLAAQYAVQPFSVSSYFMITWIWLGFGYSFLKSEKYLDHLTREANRQFKFETRLIKV